MANWIRSSNPIAENAMHARDEYLERHLRLWASVLRQGMIDAAKEFKQAMDEAVEPEIFEAYSWLMSDADHPTSFVWCCQLVDIDPARARSAWRMNVRSLANQRTAK